MTMPRDATPSKKMQSLWLTCQAFIRDNEISCPEAILQVDSTMENAEVLIEDIAELVGWYKEKD
jgi:hypothetical protein